MIENYTQARHDLYRLQCMVREPVTLTIKGKNDEMTVTGILRIDNTDYIPLRKGLPIINIHTCIMLSTTQQEEISEVSPDGRTKV